MPYATVEDVAVTWESYVRFAAELEQRSREGLILHAAGRTDEGVRIIEVWESEEAWQRFAATAAGRIDGSRFADAPRYLREFRPTHLVIAGKGPGSPTEEATHA